MKREKALRWFSVLLAAVMLLSLVGCGSSTSSSSSTSSGTSNAAPEAATNSSSGTGSNSSASGSTAQTSAKKDTLKVALPTNVTQMYGNRGGTNAMNPTYCMFECLTKWGEDFDLEPLLATSWEMTDDTTWRFHLREDVYFHDGSKFTADDVVASIERYTEMDPTYFYAEDWTIAWPPVAEAESEYSVLIHTPEKSSVLPGLLTRVIMVPEEYKNDPDFFTSGFNGTGAYTFVSWEPGMSIVFKANPNYWGGAPEIENIEFSFVTDSSARVASYLANEYDLVFDISYDQADSIAANPDYKIVVKDLIGLSFIYFNQRNFANSPCGDVRIRQAMNYAIDSYGITEAVMNGYANPITGIANSNVGGAHDNGGLPHRDLDKAKALMEEAGYNNEEIRFIFVEGEFNGSLEVAELIVSQLMEAGFNITITMMDESQWSYGYQYGTGWDLACNNVPGGFYGTADYHWIHTLKKQLGWENEEVDRLIYEAMYADNETDRDALISEAMDIVWNLWPYCWGAEAKGVYGVAKDLEGLEFSPLNIVFFEKAHFN